MNTYNCMYNHNRKYLMYIHSIKTSKPMILFNKLNNTLESTPRYFNWFPIIISKTNFFNNNYSIFYLCINNKDLQYTCKKFSTYSGAQYFYNINYRYINNNYDIISVCKFIPNFFHKYVLAYKLKQSLFNIEINN